MKINNNWFASTNNEFKILLPKNNKFISVVWKK